MPLIRHRRAPCGARPFLVGNYFHTHFISIHAPLAGRDDVVFRVPVLTFPFQSTRPLRGATGICLAFFKIELFQSTRPLRGATFDGDALHVWMCISIHAPLAGRDTHRRSPAAGDGHFNPRAPCGARRYVQRVRVKLGLISIHAPLAGRDVRGGCSLNWEFISIHAPLAGRDKERFITAGPPEFQSTRPLRGATNPNTQDSTRIEFQSTRPLRGATSLSALCPPPPGISIHAPLAGRDASGATPGPSTATFQSTRPLRGATQGPGGRPIPSTFQSTRPLRGATHLICDPSVAVLDISIHAPLAGRDLLSGLHGLNGQAISIHAPLAGRDRTGPAGE